MMTPPDPYIANQFRHLIYYHLDNGLTQNALFVAGRLFAFEPRSQEASYLLALCHIRLDQYKTAYDISRTSGAKGVNLGCVYIFAQACLALERYQEGIRALDRARGLWGSRNNWNKHSETARQAYPDAAAVWCLLGKLWHGHNDVKEAVDCYVESLKHNPFMWDAFTGLCETGAAIRVQNIFKTNPEMLAMLSSVDSNANSMTILEEPATISLPLQSTRSASNPFGATDPFASQPIKGHSESGSSIGNAGLFRKLNESTMSGLQAFTSSGNLRPRTEGLETPPGATREAEILHTQDPIAPGVPEPPQAPVRRARTAQGMHSEAVAEAPPRMRGAYARPRSRLKSDDQESSDNGHNGVHGERKRTISGQVAQPHLTRSNDLNNAPQRRSDRLLNQIRPISSKFSSATGGISSREGRELKKAKATGTKGRVGTATSTVGRAISGNRKLPSDSMDLDAKETHSRPPLPTSHSAPVEPIRSRSSDSSKKEEALQWILSLFATLGHGLFCLTHFCSDKAMETFAALPTPQRETPWVLAQMGRAHYEQANYTEAEEYFAKIRSVAPARMEDMEIYSTVLWHLKNDVELAYLAHELIEVDRLSPQAWCCVGNSFSLQRDHDQALKCFKRATQLDPKFAYAFTLQGHEHIANEEHDKAQAAYRSAISVDNRHYNAWYGLGKVYEKMGKYETAEKHYRTAAQINTTNAVLICCIGVVLEKLRMPSDALRHYTRACELAPRSALARFKKARVLMTMQEPHKALAELMILKDIAPDEANVHYLLGRLYKMLRQKANAIKHFTISLNLDPKAGPYIKQSIESLEDDEDDDEVDDDRMTSS